MWYDGDVKPTPGSTFSCWTVLPHVGSPLRVPCRCICGTEREVHRYSLSGGSTRSCGCTTRTGPKRKHHINPGDRFERWTALTGIENGHVFCRCECGTERSIAANNLYMGSSRSCGCLKNERAAEMGRRHIKHGLGGTPIYACWKHMMRRCNNPNAEEYPGYGGRGITVHGPWHDAAVFAVEVQAEIGPLLPDMTLDRVDNDGNYAPGNIRWATRLEQAGNRRNTWTARRADEFAPLGVPLPRQRSKLSQQQVIEILEVIATGVSQTAAAAQFGISQPHVSRIVRDARKAAKGT